MGEFVFPRRVRWEDCDSAQIIYYANYFKYLEQAEEEMFRTPEFSYKEVKEKYGITISKLESECRYKTPSTYDDALEIHSSFSDLEGSRYTNHFRVTRGDDTLASGYVQCICRKVDGNITDDAPIPEELERILRQYMQSS